MGATSVAGGAAPRSGWTSVGVPNRDRFNHVQPVLRPPSSQLTLRDSASTLGTERIRAASAIGKAIGFAGALAVQRRNDIVVDIRRTNRHASNIDGRPHLTNNRRGPCTTWCWN